MVQSPNVLVMTIPLTDIIRLKIILKEDKLRQRDKGRWLTKMACGKTGFVNFARTVF